MKFVSSFEKKMLFNYLKQNIEWLCLEPSKKNACVGAGCTIYLMNLNLLSMKTSFSHAWNATRLWKDLIKKYKKRVL